MHNGSIENFDKIKRRLRSKLDDEYYNFIQGTTDSEHAFALFLNTLKMHQSDCSTNSLKAAFTETLQQLELWCKEAGVPSPSRLNFALTDGNSVIASRYTTATDRDPPTLYISLGDRFESHEGKYRMISAKNKPQTAITASEPLTDSATKSGIPTPLWLSWLLLLTAVCISVWFIDLPDTEALWSVKTLLSSSWPILLGAVITGSVLLLWRKGFYPGGLTLPPGDILVIVERLLKYIPLPQPTEHKHGKTSPATTQSSAAIRAITAPELLIKRWATAICLFLFTVLSIFGLLALNFAAG